MFSFCYQETWGIKMQAGHSTLELNSIKHSSWDFYLIPFTQQGQTPAFKRLSLSHLSKLPGQVSSTGGRTIGPSQNAAFAPFMIPWAIINMKKLVVTNLMYSRSILPLSLYGALRVFVCQGFFCLLCFSQSALSPKKFWLCNKIAESLKTDFSPVRFFPPRHTLPVITA